MPIVELYERSARSRYSEIVRDVARHIPGLRWDAENRHYVGYPDAIEAFARRLDATGNATLIERRTAPLKLDFQAPGLRPYQQEGVNFLCTNAQDGVILSDDVGLGKSAQAIVAAKVLSAKRIVIVCPAVVKEVWRREIAKWWAEMAPRVRIAIGTKGPPITIGWFIAIFNYEILKSYAPAPSDLIIFDEGHYLQNYKSQRSVAAKAWAKLAKFRILLSATPMSTRPKNLHNLCETISPGRFGPFIKFKPIVSGFAISYCDGHQETIDKEGTTVWNFDGPSAERLRIPSVKTLNDELAMRLRFFMLRRTKAEVMKDLPPRSRQVVEVNVPAAAIIPVGFDDRDALRRALDVSGAAKAPNAVLFARDLLAQGQRVVLFAHLRETARRLGVSLKCPVITGAMGVADRHAVIDLKPVAIAATMDSLATGVDMSHFDSAIFVDLDYVPWKVLQLEGRLHRFGQKSAVNFYYMIGLGTVDERIRDVVINRLELYEKVLGDKEASLMKTELKGMALASSETELLKQMRAAVITSEGHFSL